MRNFGILVRTNLRIFIGSLKNKRKGRYVATGILLGFGLLALGLSLAFQAVSQMFLLRDAGIPDVGIFMSLVSALMLGGLFGLMRFASARSSSGRSAGVARAALSSSQLAIR